MLLSCCDHLLYVHCSERRSPDIDFLVLVHCLLLFASHLTSFFTYIEVCTAFTYLLPAICLLYYRSAATAIFPNFHFYDAYRIVYSELTLTYSLTPPPLPLSHILGTIRMHCIYLPTYCLLHTILPQYQDYTCVLHFYTASIYFHFVRIFSPSLSLSLSLSIT